LFQTLNCRFESATAARPARPAANNAKVPGSGTAVVVAASPVSPVGCPFMSRNAGRGVLRSQVGSVCGLVLHNKCRAVAEVQGDIHVFGAAPLWVQGKIRALETMVHAVPDQRGVRYAACSRETRVNARSASTGSRANRANRRRRRRIEIERKTTKVRRVGRIQIGHIDMDNLGMRRSRSRN
jgi:hypothetical protein